MKTRILSILLLISMLLMSLAGCAGGNGQHESTSGAPNATTDDPLLTDEPIVTDSEPNVVTPEEGDKVINVIFALATVPPVLAALDAIQNGRETYVLIERGKTYNGIDSIENFHNAGFDPSVNLANGFTQKELDAMTETLKGLKGDNTFFEFYAQDGTALYCAAVAANAGISTEDYHVTMCEDGSGAYVALDKEYINGNFVSEDIDIVYTNYMEKYEEAKALFETVASKTDNRLGDPALKYNIARAFALASLPNFTYYLQDRTRVEGILKNTGSGTSKLLSSFGVEGYLLITDTKLNLRYGTIADAISRLPAEKKEVYLKLMYGSYYEETYASLTRSETHNCIAVSENKLVFIGGRHSTYPKFASSEKHGIGGLVEGQRLPDSYVNLPDKYKSILLFPTEADYRVLLDVLNDPGNYPAGTQTEAITKAKIAVFNMYIDYIFTLKLTYQVFCYTAYSYDLIMKGHPREALGASAEWGKRYRVKLTDGSEFVIDELLDKALMAFHKSDSTGCKIGTIPYGTAAENLAYLGANITVGGLPSSTYSGLDRDIPVRFIIAETDEEIRGDVSQVKDRVYDGSLTYKTASGMERLATYINTGRMYKEAAIIFTRTSRETLKAQYNELMVDWLRTNYNGAKDVNEEGRGT